MKIPLSRGLFAIVDDADADLIAPYIWHARWNKTAKTYYAQTNVKRDEVTTTLQMHRLLFGSPPPVIEIDHRNGNGLDNSRRNLRTCSHGENQRNRRKQNHRSSRFKGVCFHKVWKKWQAYINFEKRRCALGYFQTEEEAAQAYDKKAKELFGEFAHLNFPDKRCA